MKKVILFDPITQERKLLTIKQVADIFGVKPEVISCAKCRKSLYKGFYILEQTVTGRALKPLVQIGDLEEEIWRSIPDTKVEVSNYGRYKGPTGILVINKTGDAARITLTVKGKRTSYTAHHWVGEMFIGKTPEGMFRAHKDGNGFNNRVENLIDVSKGYINKQIAIKKRAIPIVQIDPLTNEIVEEYTSMAEAAKALYTTRDVICRAVNKGYVSLGYIWKKDLSIHN